ncbi:uncharacterized protein LACBIDRAFT_298905 [Laccaria bicolor S238N-H82]|uniref:Predicted protein n=1 Tax=Laccaria bicolor (strain S238N-H82 / ATCC MYA-4686) TaxID=486041 RepID=B0DDJ8_LACBS|nr:uncharacterized protein LACBIDRAFT_298905 [Laccaria bicolor S238N-H82]EDR07230.1 predicted protein [Laccaria bicolor S238N-H82]|eukprot:XP_001882161.1 predicted protein [Laccaria bicolor S238N-H82]
MYHEWMLEDWMGPQAPGYKECKGGNCGSNTNSAVVIEHLANLSSCDLAALYVKCVFHNSPDTIPLVDLF